VVLRHHVFISNCHVHFFDASSTVFRDAATASFGRASVYQRSRARSGVTAPQARVTPGWFFCGQSRVSACRESVNLASPPMLGNDQLSATGSGALAGVSITKPYKSRKVSEKLAADRPAMARQTVSSIRRKRQCVIQKFLPRFRSP
jgi:hypothetical protein